MSGGEVRFPLVIFDGNGRGLLSTITGAVQAGAIHPRDPWVARAATPRSP